MFVSSAAAALYGIVFLVLRGSSVYFGCLLYQCYASDCSSIAENSSSRNDIDCCSASQAVIIVGSSELQHCTSMQLIVVVL
jgi:hypothetical protein